MNVLEPGQWNVALIKPHDLEYWHGKILDWVVAISDAESESARDNPIKLRFSLTCPGQVCRDFPVGANPQPHMVPTNNNKQKKNVK